MDQASEAAARPFWRRARFWVGAALAVNLLDLTTAILPSVTTHAFKGPPRGAAVLVVQFLLAAVAVAWLVGRRDVLVDFWRRIPIPRPARVALGVFVAGHLVHVAFQIEHFPFTNVGMFTFYVPAVQEELHLGAQYLVPGEDGELEVLSLRRMGDYWLHGDISVDHQVSLMYINYLTDPLVYELVRREREALGLPPPLVADVWVRFDDGEPVLSRIVPLRIGPARFRREDVL